MKQFGWIIEFSGKTETMCLEFGNTTIMHFAPQSSGTVSLQPELPVQSTIITPLLAQRSARWKGWINLGAIGLLALGYCPILLMPIGKAADQAAVVVEDTAKGKDVANPITTRERVRKAISAGASIARNVYNKVTTVYDANGNPVLQDGEDEFVKDETDDSVADDDDEITTTIAPDTQEGASGFRSILRKPDIASRDLPEAGAKMYQRLKSAAFGATAKLVPLSASEKAEYGRHFHNELLDQRDENGQKFITIKEAPMRLIQAWNSLNRPKLDPPLKLYYIQDAPGKEIVNAFVHIGSYVYVHSGLMDQIPDNDAALAYVLGHEITHISSGHVDRPFAAIKGASLLGPLKRFKMIGLIGAELLFRGYSKGQEFEADEGGYDIAVSAGYDKNEALGMFDALEQLLGRPTEPSNTLGQILDQIRRHGDSHPLPHERRDHLVKYDRKRNR